MPRPRPPDSSQGCRAPCPRRTLVAGETLLCAPHQRMQFAQLRRVSSEQVVRGDRWSGRQRSTDGHRASSSADAAAEQPPSSWRGSGRTQPRQRSRIVARRQLPERIVMNGAEQRLQLSASPSLLTAWLANQGNLVADGIRPGGTLDRRRTSRIIGQTGVAEGECSSNRYVVSPADQPGARGGRTAGQDLHLSSDPMEVHDAPTPP